MKIFAISDPHGYYTEMRTALDEAGFDPTNKDHFLVIAGDLIDRGPDPGRIIAYARDLLSTGRVILIRGNHEDLFEAACMRRRCLSHDLFNGTLGTILALNGLTSSLDLTESHFGEAYRKMRPILNEMVNFYETRHYVFCHAWISVTQTENGPIFNPDWRGASPDEWRAARWLNPFEMSEKGLFPDKTVVSGHWHCSAGWAQKLGTSEFGDDACFNIFYEDGHIGLDSCTVRTGKVNCLVVDDELLSTEEVL